MMCEVLNQYETHTLGSRIRKSFQSDCDYCALQAGHAVMANLAGGQPRGVQAMLRGRRRRRRQPLRCVQRRRLARRGRCLPPSVPS